MEHLTTEQLALYSELLHNNELEKVPQEISEHIKTCDSCAAETIEMSFILDEIKPKVKEVNIIKINYKYRAIAASVILLISLGVGLKIFLQDSKNYSAKQIQPLIKTTNFAQRKIPDSSENNNSDSNNFAINNNNNIDNKLIALYIPDKTNEKLVENFKGNMRGEEFKILSKSEIETSLNKAITLEWENTKNTKLTIEIFDNKGTNIESEACSKNSYTIAKSLLPGLYYWKIFNEEYDLLFCGKINVNN